MVKAKIHRATVTQADLNYVGSLTIDANLMEICDILPNEQVHIVNVTNGHRMVTYAIRGEPFSGVMCLNGAAARHGQKGDIIIVMTFAHYSDEEARAMKPQVVVVDEQNQPVQVLHEEHNP
jgi:aspartate 1-decarboxylase